MTFTIHHGDALDVLRAMPTASVDAIVTDPPSGIGFMGAEWDRDKGGRAAWVAWLAEIFTEARRVAKPGAHALVWALPRTSHWTATGLEDAGWELRDRVAHFFGTGFPKSRDVSKDLDRAAGARREVVGTIKAPGMARSNVEQGAQSRTVYEFEKLGAPATDLARQWEGWGTALKPAVEDWHLARAPLSEGTVAANVARWGCGALAIDATRIAADEGRPHIEKTGETWAGSSMNACGSRNAGSTTQGRWPAHLVMSHEDGCRPLGTARVKAAPAWNDNRPASAFTGAATSPVHHADDDGTETVERWACVEGCAVRVLDEQSGLMPASARKARTGNSSRVGHLSAMRDDGQPFGHSDSGGASRFFFCAKPSTAEREMGLDSFQPATTDDGRETTNDTAYQRGATMRRNIHPTVKSVALMRWLMRLITPPGGLVLDLFTGSGTTGLAAMCEGVRFVGVEQSEEFARIARARIAFAAANPRAFDPETVRGAKPDARQVDLFGKVGT